MQLLTAVVGPLAAQNAAKIANSQSGTGGTALTLNANTVLDTPRRINIVCAGNESAHTFLLTGLNWANVQVSETITGVNASNVASAYDYWSVLSVVPQQTTTSTVSVGTSNNASTCPLKLDGWALAPVALQCDITGTVNVSVQSTLDDYNVLLPISNANPQFPNWTWIPSYDANAVNASASFTSYYTATPGYVRLYLNSGTGQAVLKVLQASSSMR
jgi:hypothetical protein